MAVAETMNASSRGNLLVVHGGGPTPVINASLYGVIRESIGSGKVGRVLGAVHGAQGLLAERLVDLTGLDAETLEAVRVSPGSALGSSRHKLSEDQAAQILDLCRRHDVRWFLGTGGNDTMANCLRLHQQCDAAGQPLTVVGVPKTVDNDLAETDHCPGYGSAARYLAQSVRDLCCDVSALPTPVSILETMGRNTGWLCASAALARESAGDGPHLICVPEEPLDPEGFLVRVKEVVDAIGWAVVVVSEGLRDASGRPIAESAVAAQRDPFGHALPGGVGASLSELVAARLGLRCRYEKPGLLGRASRILASDVDRAEAEAVGAEAVRRALAGKGGVMITLTADRSGDYRWGTGTVALDRVANVERTMPDEFLSAGRLDVTASFIEYARPLIGDDLLSHQHVRPRP